MDGRADNVVTAGAAGLSAMLPVVRWGEMAPEGAVCAMTEEQHARLDELEVWIKQQAEANGQEAHEALGLNQAVGVHEHHFFPGLYVRVMHLRAGSVATSLMHGREHPFAIMSGTVSVWNGADGAKILRAPYIGRTLPGTRRALYMVTDVTWVTFHLNPGNFRNPEDIMREHIIPHENPLLGAGSGDDECNEGGAV